MCELLGSHLPTLQLSFFFLLLLTIAAWLLFYIKYKIHLPNYKRKKKPVNAFMRIVLNQFTDVSTL